MSRKSQRRKFCFKILLTTLRIAMHETTELSVALVDLALEKGVNQVKTAYFSVLIPLSGIGALASHLTDQTLCTTFFMTTLVITYYLQ